MNGLITILVGGILVTNLFLILYLYRDKKEDSGTNINADEEPPKVTESKSSDTTESDTDSIIAQSKFDVDLFASQIGEKLMAELPRMFNAAIGEVTLSQVEFATEDPSSKESVPSPNQKEETTVNPQLSPKGMADAFDTDIRDVEEPEPSAPVSSGATFDELEAAVSVAMDENATDEAKAKAGDLFRELQDTQLFDKLSEFDEIGERVDFCLRMSVRAQFSAEYRKKNPKKPVNQNTDSDKSQASPPPVSKPKSTLIDLDNVSLDDFDPESLLL